MPASGAIMMDGRDLVADQFDARARRRLGLAHVPEDRLRMGVVASYSAEDNAILGYHDRPVYNRGVVLNRRAIRAECEKIMAAHDVRPPLPGLRITAFSGGN